MKPERFFKGISAVEIKQFLEYSSKINIAGSWYIVKIRQSTFENEDLTLILALTLFILLSSAFMISFLSIVLPYV